LANVASQPLAKNPFVAQPRDRKCNAMQACKEDYNDAEEFMKQYPKW